MILMKLNFYRQLKPYMYCLVLWQRDTKAAWHSVLCFPDGQSALLTNIASMKKKNKRHSDDKVSASKDELSQNELIAGVSSFSLPDHQRPPLERPDGKNYGSGPPVSKNHRRWQT